MSTTHGATWPPLTPPPTELPLGKLRPDVKAQWVAALRSGTYAQGKGYLHANPDGDDTYCCLGVLCDLSIGHGVTASTSTEEDDTPCTGYGPHEQTSLPPGEIVAWAYEIPPVPERQWNVPVANDDHPSGVAHLAELNDDGGLTFAEIADLVEEYL